MADEHVNMSGRVRVLVDLEEIDWLRFFRDKVEDALGPASDDIIDELRFRFDRGERV